MSVKVQVAEGEVCWAEPISGKLYRLINTPFVGDYNLWDVVEVEEINDMMTATKLVLNVFPRKTVIEYDQNHQFPVLIHIFKLVNAQSEGCIGADPDSGRRGIMVVAHGNEVDPRMIAEGLNIEQSTDLDKEQQQQMKNELKRLIATDEEFCDDICTKIVESTTLAEMEESYPKLVEAHEKTLN